MSFAPVLAIVLLAWFGAGGDTTAPGAAVRFAGAVWLLGHGIAFHTAIGPVSLVPLPLTAVIVWRLVRAGQHTTRAVGARTRVVPQVVAAIGLGYAAVGGAVALAVSTSDVAVRPAYAFSGCGVVALLSALVGAWHETGAWRRGWRRLTWVARAAVRYGTLSAAAVLAAGAAVCGAAIAVRWRVAADLYASYGGGAATAAGLTLVCLLYAPTASVWAASYLVGPGFAVGTGTTVSLVDVSLGHLPALPLLAGLPPGPAPPAAGLLLGVPVAAGALAGAFAARRHPDAGWRQLISAVALCGPVCGLLLAATAWTASGALGAGRLSLLGPVPWQTGLAVAAVVAVAACTAAAVSRWIASRGDQVAAQPRTPLAEPDAGQ